MDKHKDFRIIITGGHATPAVACINELRERGYNNFTYIGQKKSLLFDKNNSSEYKLITESVKLPFKSIIAGKFSLFLNFSSLVWLLRIPVGFMQALWWQITLKPKLILTFGSHVGIPVVFWAWIFHTPIIVHEQTVTLGRSNRFIQKFATKICYSWQKIPETPQQAQTKEFKQRIKTTRFFYTGNPMRKAIFKPTTNKFNFTNKKPVLFITGGNQGAHRINEFIFQNLEALLTKYNIIHQTGSNSIYNDITQAQKLAKELNSKATCYMPVDYVFADEMAEAYAKASVIITRAGANTVTEIIALKKKALLIPIPTTAGNEQFIQSKFVEELGLGISINQSELDSLNLLQILSDLENKEPINPEKIELIATLHKNAEKRIIDIVENTLRNID